MANNGKHRVFSLEETMERREALVLVRDVANLALNATEQLCNHPRRSPSGNPIPCGLYLVLAQELFDAAAKMMSKYVVNDYDFEEELITLSAEIDIPQPEDNAGTSANP